MKPGNGLGMPYRGAVAWPWLALIAVAAVSQLPRIPKRPRAPQPLPVSLTLSALGSGGEQTVRFLPGKPNPGRPVLSARTGDRPLIRYTVANLDAAKGVGSIVVHFLIHKIGEVGEAIPDNPRKGSFQDTVVGLELGPSRTVKGQSATPIDEAGIYLIELEILDDQGSRRQIAAADLRVEGPEP